MLKARTHHTLDPHLFTLHEAVQQAGLESNSNVAEMMDALWDGRYGFRGEPWHCAQTAIKTETLPQEMLLELYDKNQGRIRPEAALNAFYDSGLHAAIDMFLVPAALRAAKEKKIGCISVNISLRSLRAFSDAVTQESCAPLDSLLSGFKPSRVVLEVLESRNQSDHIIEQDDVNALDTLCALGFRIALDDLTVEERNILRLIALGPYSDYLKIDGHLIEQWRQGNGADLIWLLKDIEIMRERGFCKPRTFILAEWVKTATEAATLSELGVNLVQGRDLLAADFRPAAEIGKKMPPPLAARIPPSIGQIA